MIDISHKKTSLRYAKAEGKLFARPETIQRARDGKVPKGDVAQVARAAGIMAGKKAAEWMVFCHTMPLDWVEIDVSFDVDCIRFIAEVKAVWKTGVEMEAVSAVMGAMLNAYDMLKPIQSDIEMGEIKVVDKRGGKSDMSDDFDPPVRTVIISVDSDKKDGKRHDNAAQIIRDFLEKHPVEVLESITVQEKRVDVEKSVHSAIDDHRAELIFLCGSTGPGGKDLVPSLIRGLSEKEVPGISRAIHQFGIQRTPKAMISDPAAGIFGKTLLVGVPGSSSGAEESMHAVFPGLLHIFKTLRRGTG